RWIRGPHLPGSAIDSCADRRRPAHRHSICLSSGPHRSNRCSVWPPPLIGGGQSFHGPSLRLHQQGSGSSPSSNRLSPPGDGRPWHSVLRLMGPGYERTHGGSGAPRVSDRAFSASGSLLKNISLVFALSEASSPLDR